MENNEDRLISKEWEDVLKKAAAAATIAGGTVILKFLTKKWNINIPDFFTS